MPTADEFPRDALQWALDNWDAASPRLIAKLRAYAGGAPLSEADLDVLFYVIHLCGEKCDSRAYVPLCDLIASDETFDVWFGETTTGTLAGILINLCDGDVEPLKRAIEAPEADEFARAAAMEALAYLVRAKGVLDDDEMRAYLSRLAREMQPRAENRRLAGLGFRYRATRLRAAARRSRARLLEKMDRPRPGLARRILRGFATGAKRPARHGRVFGVGHRAIRILDRVAQTVVLRGRRRRGGRRGRCGDLADDFEARDAPLAEDLPIQDGTPYLNPFRDVGRNDPCPCGSGKKYKKCCLAA